MLDGVMKTSLPQLNCPPVIRGNVSKKSTHFRTKVNPSMAIQVSPILLPTEENRSLFESKSITGSNTAPTRFRTPDSLFCQENTVGVIGGLSEISTLVFLEKLVYWSSRNGKEGVPFIVCNVPALNRELLVYRDLVNGKLESANETSHSLIIENMRRKRLFLEQSGAKCIVMPCHMSHVWHTEVSESCSTPFLNVGDCVCQELKEAKLRPLEAGSNVRIGVLATDAALVGGFYQEKLRHEGFEGVLPDRPTMEHMVLPSVEAMNRKDIEGARNLLRIAIQVLLVRGVNAIILAADEFQGLLPHDEPLLKKCIDPMDALARSTVGWAQSKQKLHKNL